MPPAGLQVLGQPLIEPEQISVLLEKAVELGPGIRDLVLPVAQGVLAA
jgi:hypothetical protein